MNHVMIPHKEHNSSIMWIKHEINNVLQSSILRAPIFFLRKLWEIEKKIADVRLLPNSIRVAIGRMRNYRDEQYMQRVGGQVQKLLNT